jgi:archaeosortase C (PEF-CTERM variant)
VVSVPRQVGLGPPDTYMMHATNPRTLTDRPSPKAYLQLLLGLVLAFQGLALAITSPKEVTVHWWMRFVGVAMAAGGLWYLYRYLPREVLTLPMSEAAKQRAAHELVRRLSKGDRPTTLAERLIDRLTLQGRLVPFFPVAGAVIVLLDVYWNLVLTGSREFLTYDWLTLMTGGFLIVYDYVPKDFRRERDFAFVFLLALALMLVVPVMLERAAEGNAASEVGISAYSEYLLAKPVDGMMRLSGVDTHIDGVTISFDTVSGTRISLLIATSCSGVYSFAIFTAAFLAFAASEFREWDRRLKWFLLLGIVAAYVANLLRMYIIVMVGHLWGSDALLWAHANAGWLIYMAWVSAFWWLLFRWFWGGRERGAPGRPRRGLPQDAV